MQTRLWLASSATVAIVAAGVASVAPIARIALTRGLGVSGVVLGLA